MPEPLLVFENVHKSYRGLKAVAGVSFEIQRSTCFGLLGPNGAGKSTIMRLTYAKSTRDREPASRIRVFGFDPERDELAIKCRSGVVPQEDNLDEELNVEQNLGVFARLYGIATGPARSRIRELLDFMELGDKAKARIRELSGGMKRRLVIARALLNEPEFLILDEPTTGLDPQVRHAIWEKLRQLRRGGLTILLSTHYLEEAFQLCDEALILDKGKAILRGHPKELLEQHVEPYVLELMDGSVSSEVLARLSADAVRVERSAETTRIYGRDYRELMSATSALRPDQFHLRQSTLEDVFLKTTGRALNESQ